MVESPTVTFVGLEPSSAVREYALEKIAAILDEDVTSCRVVLEAHQHAHAGARFRAKVEIDVPHARLVVGSRGEAFGDLYAAIDAASDDAKRSLRDHADRSRSRRAV